jgi:hypothetical protein
MYWRTPGMLSKPTSWTCAQGHGIVGGHDALEIGVLGEEVGGEIRGFRGLPVSRAGVEEVELVLGHGVVEAHLPLDSVVSRWIALEDDDLAAFAKLLPKGVAGQLGTGSVVRAEEGQVDAGVCHGLLVQGDVDVDDLDAGVQRSLDGLDHRLRVGGCDDDDVELLGDVVLDGRDLRGEVLLVLHAHGLEVEDVRLGGRVVLGTRVHLLEELVGQRLHDQTDLGLVPELRRQVRERPGRLDRRAISRGSRCRR